MGCKASSTLEHQVRHSANRFDFLIDRLSSGLSATLNLSHFPHIRILAFGSRGQPFYLRPGADAKFMTPIVTILSQVISARVEQVQIFPEWLGFTLDTPVEWLDMMKILLSDRFPCLKRVVVMASDRIPMTAQIMSTLKDLVISDPRSHGIPRIAIVMKLLTRLGEKQLYPKH